MAAVVAMVALMTLLPAGRAVSGMSPQSAELLVYMTPVGAQYYGFDLNFEIHVTNPGSELLTDLTVEDEQPDQLGNRCDIVDGPFVLSGNDDDVLDPTEEWVFECSAPATYQLEGMTYVHVQVNATRPGGEQITDSTSFEINASYPATITLIEPEGQVQIEERGVATWTFEATNTSDLILDATAEVLLFERREDLRDETPVGLVDLGNGDGLFDPGETWRGSYAVRLDTEGVYYVFIDVYVTGEEPVRGGVRVRRGEYDSSGGPVVVVPVPTPSEPSTPASTLPETGGGTGSASLVATVLVLLGTALIAGARIRRHGSSVSADQR